MRVILGAALDEAASTYPDSDFRTLLSRLLTAICCEGEFDPGELLRLAIIEPGDTMEVVNAELGYTLTPRWDACEQESGWHALTFIQSDWGEGLIVFIPGQQSIDPAFLRLCSETPETL